MKEYHLTPEMDRIPLASQTEADQIVDVAKDTKILNEFVHGERCGCAGCKGYATRVREALRPEVPSAEPKRLAPPPKLNRPPKN